MLTSVPLPYRLPPSQRFSATMNEFFFELELTGGRSRIFCYKPWCGGGQLPEGCPEPVDAFMKHGPLMTRVKTQEEVTTSGSVVRTRSIGHAWSREFQAFVEEHRTVEGPDGIVVKEVVEPRKACEPCAVHKVGMAWVDAFDFAIQSTKREEAPLIDLRSRIADQLFEKAEDAQAAFDSVAENSSFFTRTDDTAVFPSQASMILQYFRMKQADLKKLEESLKENAHQHQVRAGAGSVLRTRAFVPHAVSYRQCSCSSLQHLHAHIPPSSSSSSTYVSPGSFSRTPASSSR